MREYLMWSGAVRASLTMCRPPMMHPGAARSQQEESSHGQRWSKALSWQQASHRSRGLL
jgi:hypothetical protein